MPHITTCTQCGRAYEEASEEAAHAPDRICLPCHHGDQPADPRHPSERAADQALWERIVNTSPRDEVAYSPADASAEAIAEGLWEFGTNDDHDDLDRDATIASLARTLRYEGGAA